jgi:serralysin
MAQPNAYEQYMLELINAERAKVGAQPLAFDGSLNTAAEGHSQWMINNDIFSHTGSGGSNAGQRMAAAGYVFSGSWSWGENIAWATTRAPTGYQDEVQLLHTNLMNSSGHRANILNGDYREVGIGVEIGAYKTYDSAAFVTQGFAKTATNPFLTGVAFDDLDGDRFYDVGEGLRGITVTATNMATQQVYTTTTMDAGGYDLTLAPGSYSITFSGGGVATSAAQPVTINTQNIKVDLIDPTMSSGDQQTSSPPPPPPTLNPATITGTSYSETLYGTSGSDTIHGLGGADKLYGQQGNDRLEGGSGNDYLYGGDGHDVLVGGSGYDNFVFNTELTQATNLDQIVDFSTAYDTIRLENAVFQALASTGTLARSAFHTGSAAHDSTDRIIYNRDTGGLTYDPDGTGAAAATKFAQLSAGLNLTYADFIIT